ncbi:unnamed protein product [Sphagnum jensenii]|uniref:Bromo domain-containing protein n=1 Tax=Sphagnum jensenii TaxID=128206 RepID=A0ABP1AS24_9BRYO
MADKDKHRFRLVVKLPRPPRTLLQQQASSTISNNSPSSHHFLPRLAASAAVAVAADGGDSSPRLPTQSSAAASGAAAAVAKSPATTKKPAHLPQKSVPPEHTTTATISTTTTSSATIKNRDSTTPLKKRKFKALVGGDGVLVAETKKERPSNGELVAAASNSVAATGLSVHVQPAQATPSKKVLEAVLEKLKKKDTYGVFSEPVDSSLVPDYYDVIKEPMDFGTMRRKIIKGAYVTSSLFEKDILLICSNAMRYNAPDTVYYKQARSIQNAARKALDVVATQAAFPDSTRFKPQKKLHVTKKNWRNTAALRTALQPANSDYASGATLATEGDDVAWSNKAEAGHLKKVTGSNRSGSAAGDEADWDAQSFHSALKPVAVKDGRRPVFTQEYHRSSYTPRNLPAHGRGPPLAGVGGELHHIVPTGYHMEHAYAKSLSRFSVNLGFEGWNIASKRIQRVLSSGVPFGRGWVGHLEAPPGTDLTPPLSTTKAAEVKATVPAVSNHRSLLTTSPLDVVGLSTTASHTSTAPSLVTTPNVSQGPMMSASSATASTSEMMPKRVVQAEPQLEQSRGPDVATRHSKPPSNQYVNQVSSEHNLSQTPLPQQPLPHSEKQDHNSHKGNTLQPLQLQMGNLVNYGFSQPRSLQMPTSLQQNLSLKPPPDLNLRPIDSPLTPQASGQPNLLGSSQSSLFLQL